MCQHCDGPTPPSPDKSANPSRRTLLAVGGAFAVGVGIGLGIFWQRPRSSGPVLLGRRSTQPAPPATEPLAVAPEAEIRSVKPETSAAETVPENPATQPLAATEPAPDLGAEVFPDAAGRALVKASDAPVIIVPRTDWTSARPKLAQIVPMGGISRATVHHTAGSITTDAWNPTAADLEGIREFHAGTRPTDRNWADIAYHFAVDRAGRVWQARPLAYQGAHARGHNEHNLGIVLLGNFEVQSPTAAQLIALTTFLSFVRRLYRIRLDQVFTHGELVDTSCPGKLLQDYMTRTRQSWAAQEGTTWSPTTVPRSAPEPRRGGSTTTT
jgi:hypothetical protein